MTALKLGIGVAVAVAAAIFIWSAVRTSTARVAATTDNQSLFSAGTLTLDRPDGRASLLLNADGLYPGLEVDGCVEIAYDGSVPAALRLHGDAAGGSNLEDFVDIVIERSPLGGSCSSFGLPGRPVYDGRLGQLWRRHPDYAQGITLSPQATAGSRLALRARATVVDDNDAQGRSTEFLLTVEVRPS